MPLPDPASIIELSNELKKANSRARPDDFAIYERVYASLMTGVQDKLELAAGVTLQHLITQGFGASSGVVISGLTLFPIGVAIGPWIGAISIILKSDGIFTMHDLRQEVGRNGSYACTCGECVRIMTYVIDKGDRKLGVHALSIFTVGIPSAVQLGASIYKSTRPNRPKEINCKQLCESARDGCIGAMAIILTLCSAGDKKGTQAVDILCQICAIILADNGWKMLKEKW